VTAPTLPRSAPDPPPDPPPPDSPPPDSPSSAGQVPDSRAPDRPEPDAAEPDRAEPDRAEPDGNALDRPELDRPEPDGAGLHGAGLHGAGLAGGGPAGVEPERPALAPVVRLPVRGRAGLPVAGAPGGARPRVCRPPALEPPYDDECGPVPVLPRYDQPLPFEQFALEPAGGGDFGPRPTRRADLPDPERWASVLAQALLETLAGRRSPAQLREWTGTGAYASLVAVSGLDRWAGQRRGAPPVVRSVRVGEPADGVAEAAVVAQLGDRCLAVALRLEGLDGRWQCTAIRVG
jgi:Family of unknown function (DUF6459)